jgi:streptogramin lyase
VSATIAAGAGSAKGTIAASTDSVWLLTDDKATLSRIDPDQNAVTGEFRLPAGCQNLIFAETSLWIACPGINKVLRINPATNVVDKRIEVSAAPMTVVAGQGSIWVLCAKEGKIDRIDPKTDKVSKTIDLGAPLTTGDMAFGEGYIWVTMNGFPLTRVDATTETVAQQFWGEGGGGPLVTSTGALWLTNLNSGTISRIDPKLILATLAE